MNRWLDSCVVFTTALTAPGRVRIPRGSTCPADGGGIGHEMVRQGGRLGLPGPLRTNDAGDWTPWTGPSWRQPELRQVASFRHAAVGGHWWHDEYFCCGRSFRMGWAGWPQQAQAITATPPNSLRTATVSSRRRYASPALGVEWLARERRPLPRGAPRVTADGRVLTYSSRGVRLHP